MNRRIDRFVNNNNKSVHLIRGNIVSNGGRGGGGREYRKKGRYNVKCDGVEG